MGEVRSALADADANGDRKIDYEEFVEVMRIIREDNLRQEFASMMQSMDGLGFSRAELKELRDLFNMTDADKSGDVDFDELKSIVSHIVPLCSDAVLELRTFVMNVDDGDLALNFVEFAKLMKMLQDKNWRN